jgi:hypothetical protein
MNPDTSPAKPYRSYQQRTPEWSCTQCPDAGSGQDAEDQGGVHRDAAGHEVHVVFHAVVILRPADAEADR